MISYTVYIALYKVISMKKRETICLKQIITGLKVYQCVCLIQHNGVVVITDN